MSHFKQFRMNTENAQALNALRGLFQSKKLDGRLYISNTECVVNATERTLSCFTEKQLLTLYSGAEVLCQLINIELNARDMDEDFDNEK